jgi:hypothetical protein
MRPITRRTHVTVLAATLAGTVLQGKETDPMRELLELSRNEKKGVILYVRGQSISGVVTKITGDVVELRSREYSRMVVKIDSIDGAAVA